MCSTIFNIWNSIEIPPHLNRTYIALISKTKNANSISQFRPISLCNTLYKVFTKILANRMKLFLNHIISPTQAAFLPSRRTTDNTIIVQEVLHFLHSSNSRKHYFILKLDIEKAFDKLEWSFIRAALKFFHFPIHFINLVMAFLSLSMVILLLISTTYFYPSKGIRQGDRYLLTYSLFV